jgi:hypothetical protein
MGHWIYQGDLFTDPQDYCGFVYEIKNTGNNKTYIGKKLFTAGKSRQVKKKRKKYRVESDWRTYWGSSTALQDDVARLGEDQFTRTILYLGKTKAALTYIETWAIFYTHALIDPNSYNAWVSCRIRREHLKSTDLPEYFFFVRHQHLRSTGITDLMPLDNPV